MYIDESGSSRFGDFGKYYVLSGIIIHHDNIKNVKREIFEYKFRYFKDSYLESEIHTHDICKTKDEFAILTKDEKYNLLDKLYNTITELPINVISVAIDKELFHEQHPTWKVFKMAWVILASRFNVYLDNVMSHKERGILKIDKSSSVQESQVNKIVKEMQKHPQELQRLGNIDGRPFFINSDGSEGIQIADAVAYCTSRYLAKMDPFYPHYWKRIENKMVPNPKGGCLGYGLIVYPSKSEI